MQFIQENARVELREEIASGVCVLHLKSPAVAARSKPGQFLNIRTIDSFGPLLRRPFSISNTDGGKLEILFNVIGRGTQILSRKNVGDEVDLLGPLGRPFNLEFPQNQALLVGGGLGVAPLPFLSRMLSAQGKRHQIFVGARSAGQVVTRALDEPHIATDDGSRGFRGTVVELVQEYLGRNIPEDFQLFGCGPTPMIKALSRLADQMNIPCQLSLEGDMACGIGICQGCPVEWRGEQKQYKLVCTDGPVFDSRKIALP